MIEIQKILWLYNNLVIVFFLKFKQFYQFYLFQNPLIILVSKSISFINSSNNINLVLFILYYYQFIPLNFNEKSIKPIIQRQSQTQCNLCIANDQEILILLNNLINLIKNRRQNKNKELRNISESLYTEKYEGSFLKLLKFIFAEKIMDEKTESCKHQFLHKSVQMKTEFTRRQIDIQSQSIYQFLAKRNFQLQVLNSQIKCFPKTILGEVLNKNQRQSSIQNINQTNQMLIKKEPTSIQNLLIPPQSMNEQEYQGFYYVVPINQMNMQHVFYSQNPFQ